MEADPVLAVLRALVSEGVRFKVVGGVALYRMKRDTVRPQDRADAERLKREFALDEEDD